MEGKIFLCGKNTPPQLSCLGYDDFVFDLQRFDLSNSQANDSVFSVTKGGTTQYGTASDFTTENLSNATNITVLQSFEMTSAVDIDGTVTLNFGKNRITANVSGSQEQSAISYTTGARGIFHIKSGATLTVNADVGTDGNVGGVTLSEDTTGNTKIGRIFCVEGNGNITLNGGYYDTSKHNSNIIFNAAGIIWYKASDQVSDYTKAEATQGKYYKLNNPGSITMTNVNATVGEASFALWIPEMLDHTDISGFDNDYWANFAHTINITGGSYKVSNSDSTIIPKSRGIFCVGGDSVVIDSVEIVNDYNPGIYVFNHSEATVKGDTKVTITGTLAEASGDSSLYKGGTYGVNAIATSSNSTLNVEGGTFTSKGYVAYVYSSGGVINVTGDATFNQESENTPLLQVDFDSSGYGNFYTSTDKVSALNVTSGTFNLQSENKLIGGKNGADLTKSVVITGGKFNKDVKNYATNADTFGYITSEPIGGYYIVVESPAGWNPVSSATTNTTWHYAESVGGADHTANLVATLAGSGKSLNLTTATVASSLVAIFADSILSGNSIGYTTINGSAAAVNLAITGNDSITKITGGSKADILEAGSKGTTLDGGASDDTLAGGDGADTFIFNAGKDVVQSYGTGDIVNLSGGLTPVTDGSKVSTVSGGFAIDFDNGNTLTFTSPAAGVSLQSNNKTYVYTADSIKGSDGVTLATAFTPAEYNATSDAAYVTIDGSAVSKALNLTGNAQNNVIRNGAGGGTMDGGAGDDTLVGGNGNDIFTYAAGKDVIEGYSAGDSLQATVTQFTGAKVSGNKLTFSTNVNTNTLTIVDEDGIGKVSLTSGEVLSRNGYTKDDVLTLFGETKGRVDATELGATKGINASAVRSNVVTMVGSSVDGGTYTFAQRNSKADVFEYGGGNISIVNYEAGIPTPILRSVATVLFRSIQVREQSCSTALFRVAKFSCMTTREIRATNILRSSSRRMAFCTIKQADLPQQRLWRVRQATRRAIR